MGTAVRARFPAASRLRCTRPSVWQPSGDVQQLHYITDAMVIPLPTVRGKMLTVCSTHSAVLTPYVCASASNPPTRGSLYGIEENSIFKGLLAWRISCCYGAPRIPGTRSISRWTPNPNAPQRNFIDYTPCATSDYKKIACI